MVLLNKQVGKKAVANKSYKATYTFGNDYKTLQEKGFSWGCMLNMDN